MIPYSIIIDSPVYYRKLRNIVPSTIINVPFAWEDYTMSWDELYILWNNSYAKIITAKNGVLLLPI
jgi:hypothetical protein